MTRKHSISHRAGTGVRTIPFLLVVLLLAASTQVVATSEQSSMWHDARAGVNGGVLGALAMPLTNETTGGEIILDYSEITPVVEVYTATWCLNCVTTEQALDEAIGDSDVMRIHYHRHRSEPEDPFGNNATEHRWESTYGDASTAVAGSSRVAPSTVFDGERMHLGTSPSSSSLTNDYSTSLIASQSSFSGSAQLSVSSYDSETGLMLFSWNITGSAGSDAEGSTAISLTPWLLFVEDSASFPEGSNGVGDYLHVLHDAVELDGQEGTGSALVPAAWDGDDVSVLLLIDWTSPTTECCSSNWPLPGPGLATVLLCFLGALLPSRRER
jgi:hypothetical protein